MVCLKKGNLIDLNTVVDLKKKYSKKDLTTALRVYNVNLNEVT